MLTKRARGGFPFVATECSAMLHPVPARYVQEGSLNPRAPDNAELAVLQHGEAFVRVWEELARGAGLELVVGAAVPDAGLGKACAVLVVVAGREESSGEVVAEEIGRAHV